MKSIERFVREHETAAKAALLLAVGAVAFEGFNALDEKNPQKSTIPKSHHLSYLDTYPYGLEQDFTRHVTYKDGVVTWYIDFGERIDVSREKCVGNKDVTYFSNGDAQEGTLVDYNGKNVCADYHLGLYETYPRQTALMDSLFTVADSRIREP